MDHDEQKGAQEMGQKLGIMLASLDITDETRQAVVDMLSELDFEQIIQFSDLLERKYIEASTADIDTQLRTDLLALKKEMDMRNQEIDQETMGQLAELEQELAKAENKL